MTKKPADPAQSIVVCGNTLDIGTPVILWNHKGGYACPHKRGRQACTQHDPALNDAPTQKETAYRIADPEKAHAELSQAVYQLVLHYDVCYSARHCHQVLTDSTFKGSHFYLDLDGTLYQTCDLYWKTNTAPADDGLGNERAVHVEISNLSWQALVDESDLYHAPRDLYRETAKGWRLDLPEKYRSTLRNPKFQAYASRGYGSRGYFSRRINGRTVRMWDFTEEQYQALIHLCLGIHRMFKRIPLRVPFDTETRCTPLDRINNFARFKGILGHAHVQSGKGEGVKKKHDPGSAFNWGRLRREFRRHSRKKS